MGLAPAQGGTLVDIGANLGSVAIAGVLETGIDRALAVEAHPDNARLLRANVVLNGLEDRVTAVHAAASDTDGVLRLRVIRPTNWGAHEIVEGDLKEKGTTHEVPARRLDDMAADGLLDVDDVALLWMDVQGHEPHVLAGAGRLLERGTPVATEFAPALLQRHGGLEAMYEIVRANFTHVADLREPADGPLQPQRLQDDTLPNITARLPDGRFTDLLLLRLPN